MSEACGLFSAEDNRPRTAYCGPTAIAALTGVSPEAAEAAIVAHRANHPTPRRERHPKAGPGLVRTMWSSEVIPVLAALGFKATECRSWPLPTFAQWLRLGRAPLPYLILVTGHFVAVKGDWFVDTGHRKPVPLNTVKRCKRSRVQRYWLIEKGEATP